MKISAERPPSLFLKYASMVALTLSIAVAATACSSTGGTGTTATGGSGSINGNDATLVVFIPSTSNIYVADVKKGIETEALSLGYKTKFFENNFDQSQEDQQVQQYLATGEKPAAFLWWPASAEGGQNSARQMMKIAPLFHFNQTVPEGGEKFMTAYAGHSQAAVAKASGELALTARKDDRTEGKALHSSGGNLLEFSFATGYLAGIERHDAFMEATSSEPFNLLRNEPAKTFDAQGGFEAAMQVIPKYKAEGIDYIFAHSGDIAVGVVKALEQNGLIPGKDVKVIVGNASGDPAPFLDGRIYGAVVQSPVIEGQTTVRTAAQYLATGKVEQGLRELAGEPEKPELTLDSPSVYNYMAAPIITVKNKDSLRLWGLKYGEFGGGY